MNPADPLLQQMSLFRLVVGAVKRHGGIPVRLYDALTELEGAMDSVEDAAREGA